MKQRVRIEIDVEGPDEDYLYDFVSDLTYSMRTDKGVLRYREEVVDSE